MQDYDGCVVWLVTAMRVVASPETGEHKAIIGRHTAGRYVVQSGRPRGLGGTNGQAKGGEYGWGYFDLRSVRRCTNEHRQDESWGTEESEERMLT